MNDGASHGLDDMVSEFVTECRELLEEVEARLIEIERLRARGGVVCGSMLDAIFRPFHTMKGTAGFLGFHHLVDLSHEAESLLDALRQQRFPLASDHVNVLVDTLDVCRDALAHVGKGEGDEAIAARGASLAAAIREALQASLANPIDALADPGAPASELTAAAPDGGAPTASTATADGRAPAAPSTVGAARPAGLDLGGEGPSGAARERQQDAAEAADEGRPARSEEGSRKTIRVDVEKLDALVNLVGELILAENMVAHDESLSGLQLHLDNFQKAILHLNRVTRGLHDIAMSVRMVAIEGLFKKMHRLVRDVSLKLGKEVELDIDGEGTEVDKNLIEYIGDPLIHIMRNAIDHGIEPAAERVAKGKRAMGRVRLEARHHGGEVWISVTDDGRGLDRERIVRKGVERGLVDEETAAGWPDSRVFGLVFQPGFSTAEQVTEVSGRGVGLDVVLKNIQALKGRVEIASSLGEGTTFTLRIPLTLAIIEGMLVEVGGSRFLLPLLSIRESLQLRAGMVHTLPDGRELIHVRGGFVPLVRVAELHGLGVERACDRGLAVIVEHEGRTCALHVDQLLGQRQTVIKPLPDYFGEHPAIAGCSILSNGEIALILELAGIVPANAPTSGAHRDASEARAA